MQRTTTILVAIALVGAMVAIPFGVAAAVADESDRELTATENETESVEPGERFAGVVGVQNAEIDGEVSERTYGVKVANAQTEEARADVVGERLDEVEQRLVEHETRLDELAEARESGEIGDGEYRARVATVAAETAATERAAERAQATAGELPRDVLEERGIDVEAIEELRDRASELGGEETAEIARSIAGDDVGSPVVGDRGHGAPVEAPGGNETDDDGTDRGAETDRDGQGR